MRWGGKFCLRNALDESHQDARKKGRRGLLAELLTKIPPNRLLVMPCFSFSTFGAVVPVVL